MRSSNKRPVRRKLVLDDAEEEAAAMVVETKVMETIVNPPKVCIIYIVHEYIYILAMTIILMN